MPVLRLLSEEVFDFSLENMTATKIKTMKESLNEEFARIFNLCQLVMQNSEKPPLLLSTLQTLQRFLTWIPLGYIFETGLLSDLLKFFTVPQFRTVTLDCLTEIASLPPADIPDNYRSTMINLLVIVMSRLNEMIPLMRTCHLLMQAAATRSACCSQVRTVLEHILEEFPAVF